MEIFFDGNGFARFLSVLVVALVIDPRMCTEVARSVRRPESIYLLEQKMAGLHEEVFGLAGVYPQCARAKHA